MTGGSNQRTSGKSKGGRRKEAARGGRGRKAGTRKNPEIGRTGLSGCMSFRRNTVPATLFLFLLS